MAAKNASASPKATSPSKATVVTKNVSSIKITKPKSPTDKETRLSTAIMVNEAIRTLAEKKGSSLQAIKKYMASTYNIIPEKSARHIRKYIISAVASGFLTQTKGTGAAGSFKITAKEAKPKAAKKAVAMENSEDVPSKKTTVKKPKAVQDSDAKPKAPKVAKLDKPAAQKVVVAKKPSAKKVAENEKSTTSLNKTESPKKVSVKEKKAKKTVEEEVTRTKSPIAKKATTKGPTAKPKAPKPKKSPVQKTVKVSAPKSAAPKN